MPQSLKPPPIRTCSGTGEKHPQNKLLRFTNVDGTPTPDAPNHRAPGRGVYILPTEAAYNAAIKRRAFANKLKTHRPPPPWNTLSAATLDTHTK